MPTIFGLLVLVWMVKAAAPSIKEREEIIELLTTVRENVEPPASNMMLINYSFELEATVQKWLKRCGSALPHTRVGTELEGSAMLLSRYSFTNSHLVDLGYYGSRKSFYNFVNNTCLNSFCYEYKTTNSAYDASLRSRTKLPELSTGI
uniref:SCP domain-containing protein n=1 Tax=Mesocestoides corti TaxID=53468 RepID=A0A5K3FD21_MESCO